MLFSNSWWNDMVKNQQLSPLTWTIRNSMSCSIVKLLWMPFWIALNIAVLLSVSTAPHSESPMNNKNKIHQPDHYQSILSLFNNIFSFLLNPLLQCIYSAFSFYKQLRIAWVIFNEHKWVNYY